MIEKVKRLENLLKYPILFYSIYFLYLIRPNINMISNKVKIYESLFHYVLILYGILILIYYFINRRKSIFNINLKVTILFTIFAIITVLFNLGTITMSSIKTTILTIFSMFVMLPFYKVLKEKYSRTQIFKYIFYPTIIFKFLISLISIIMYIKNISIYHMDKGELNFLGIRYVEIFDGSFTPLLYGLYNDPNYGAIFGISSIVVVLYILFSKNIKTNKFENVFLSLILITEYVYISFVNSRGAEYSIYLLLIILIFTVLIKIFVTKVINLKTGFKYILIFICAIIFIFSSLYTIRKIGYNISQNTELSSYLWYNNNDNMEYTKITDIKNLDKNIDIQKIVDKDSIKNHVTEEKKDSTEELGNGRIKIWKDTIQLYKKNPIFGIAPDMQKINAEKYSDIDSSSSMLVGRAIHNSYLNLLLCFGLAGFLVMILWLGYIFVKVFKVIIYKNKSEDNDIIFFGLLVLFSIYLFLDAVFINITFYQIFTMFFLGFLTEEYIEKGV